MRRIHQNMLNLTQNKKDANIMQCRPSFQGSHTQVGRARPDGAPAVAGWGHLEELEGGVGGDCKYTWAGNKRRAPRDPTEGGKKGASLGIKELELGCGERVSIQDN